MNAGDGMDTVNLQGGCTRLIESLELINIFLNEYWSHGGRESLHFGREALVEEEAVHRENYM